MRRGAGCTGRVEVSGRGCRCFVGLRFRVEGFGFGIEVLGCRKKILGFKFWG